MNPLLTIFTEDAAIKYGFVNVYRSLAGNGAYDYGVVWPTRDRAVKVGDRVLYRIKIKPKKGTNKCTRS